MHDSGAAHEHVDVARGAQVAWARLGYDMYGLRLEKMAKSIRSKRRQRVLSVRRERFRQKEKKKLWEKHLAMQAQRTVEMTDVEGEGTGGH